LNTTGKGSYASSGVDIDAADQAKELIKKHARSTFRPEVLTDIGSFGGMFAFKGYKEPVLVSSTDGVGTKIKIASLLNRHNTVGTDLVNHCVNDILCCGAEPLFFLDYIGTGKMIPKKIEQIVSGLAKACREVNCALIGGETAEMPGVYSGEDYDLVGTIIGVVERNAILEGKDIVAGDVILGLPSSGLHTNGYSLVRKVFSVDKDMKPLKTKYPELGESLGAALLKPHRCYFTQLKPVLSMVKGLAHITGGGFIGNIPRALPKDLAAQIDKNTWAVPPLFKLIQKTGKIDEAEMYRVFNMGIGMSVICSEKNKNTLLSALPESKIIGSVVKLKSKKRLTFY
jgi:phosphoribosylformylglycinamidine cyclo-ligase